VPILKWESLDMSTFLVDGMRTIICSTVASNTVFKKVQILLTSLEKWREINPMKFGRSTGFSLIFKSKIYVFGGYTGEKKRSKVIEVYDPFKNYWECLNVGLM
jgi:hypothetical protein